MSRTCIIRRSHVLSCRASDAERAQILQVVGTRTIDQFIRDAALQAARLEQLKIIDRQIQATND